MNPIYYTMNYEKQGSVAITYNCYWTQLRQPNEMEIAVTLTRRALPLKVKLVSVYTRFLFWHVSHPVLYDTLAEIETNQSTV